MKQLLFILLFLSLGWCWALQSPGQILFKTISPLDIKGTKTGLSDFDSFLSDKGVLEVKPLRGMPGGVYYSAHLSIMPTNQYLSETVFPGIAFMQPNYLRKLHLFPNDPRYGEQLHYVSEVESAWNYSTGSHLIKVGIVDSGVLVNHPDLHDNIWTNPAEIAGNGIDDDHNGYIDDVHGWDFADAPEMAETALGDYLDQDNDVDDENFHGTHVAGIVGAVGNNGIGVAGVCWNVTIVPLRAGFRTTGGQGFLQDDDAAAAIIYAVDNGCKVINMSWGDTSYAPIIADACEYADSRGVVLVASAGNDPGANLSYPARLSCVISVGSVGKGKVLSGFSSYGPDLDLVAVGERVLSTYKMDEGEQYFMQDGTSMSSPFVAGGAALLLSLHPELQPHEVRSWLLNSAEDLEPQGYDTRTGHGLFNAKQLLETSNPPFVEISSPPDQLGVSGTVPIIGSVFGSSFFRYSVCYASLSDPTMVGWYDVKTHRNQPEFYTAEVHNGQIAEFYIPPSFPEGKYLIRVQYEKTQDNTMKYNYFRIIEVDHSAPSLVPQSLESFTRYDGPNLRYYVAAGFDEKVRGELLVTDAFGNTHRAYSTTLDSIQVWAVPSTLPEGQAKVQFNVRNAAGLYFNSPEYQNLLNIHYELIPSHGFEKQELGNPRRSIGSSFDFDGNGTPEYVAMDLPNSGYGTVKVYEPHANAHIEKHSFDQAFWPLDIGNTNNIGGKELLLLKGDTAYLWETSTQDRYPNPNLAIWSETSIVGGLMADYDNDNQTEVMVIKNLPLERAILTYKRSSNGMLTQRATLSNPTSTYLRNNFVPTFFVDNLDGDSFKDVLCADTDGDVLVYEMLNTTATELRWTRRLPVMNTYSLAVGDFDGNGVKDFMVGGYNSTELDPNLNFWYFEGFTKQGNDSYISLGSVMFNEVSSQNSITAADLDDDGKDELVLAISPNLYVMKYQNGKFVPTFHGDGFRNYQVRTWEDTDGTVRILANVAAAEDSSRAVQWNPQEPFTGPSTPANISAVPTGANSVHISWISSGAPAYRLYIKDESDVVNYVELNSTSFTHEGLVSEASYRYAVAAVNPSFTPHESILSDWVTAVPLPQPEVESINMVSSNDVRIVFTQKMPSDYINVNYYQLGNGIGYPISANNLFDGKAIQLRFRYPLPAIDSLYVLHFNSLTGESGVPLADSTASFPFVEDVQPPVIRNAYVLANKTDVAIEYTEELSPTAVTYLPNYVLSLPQNDASNSIISASLDQNVITLRFAGELKLSNVPYFIETNNLADLAGNLISPQGKIARITLATVENLKNLKVFPNPVNSKHYPEVRFIGFPPNKAGKIAIYNSAGDLVYKSGIGPFDPFTNVLTFVWNLKNTDGVSVSSGIYFYVVEMDGEFKKGKLAIIR